ncbi:MAG: chaperone NapD [Acidobacteria bacterium]|nr:chaperone NapD [Acidobacteriota bacterium]
MKGSSTAAPGYSIASLLVRATPAALPEVLDRLNGLPGVEVHHVEQEAGRAVLTLETEAPADEAARLDGIRRTPGVLTAELVYHYVEGAGV